MGGRTAPDQPVDDIDEVLQAIPVSEAISDWKPEDSQDVEDENDDFQRDMQSSEDMEIPEGDASFNIDPAQDGGPNLGDPRRSIRIAMRREASRRVDGHILRAYKTSF